jgi:hypothetical protein
VKLHVSSTDSIDVPKLNYGAWTELWNATIGSPRDTIPDDNWNLQNWNGISIFGM